MNLKFLNAFNVAVPGAWQSFEKLGKHFGGFEKAWNASEAELKNAQIENETLARILEMRKKINPDKEWQKMEKEVILMIDKNSDKYPAILKQIPQPPHALYIRGELPTETEFCLAVVGPRKYSSYGKQACEKIVSELAANGVVIISGLALGIDAIAHQTAVDNGAKTIAVLGTGIDDKTIYPAQNLNLAKNILKNGGAIISEFAPETPGMPYHFPMRNRIVSGLSQGVIVIEAGERSGSLITASHALDQNREVFAVPGQIFSENSLGVNNLIKQGAKIVTSANDILEEFNIDIAPKKQTENLPENFSKDEIKIIDLLSGEPRELDELLKFANIPANQFNSILTMLEIRGIIKNQNGKIYKIKN